MGSKIHSTVVFENGFSGTGYTDNCYSVKIGRHGAAPYDLLCMALASCLYATFLDILNKKRINFEGAEIDVSGEKRSEIPTFLEICLVSVSIKGLAKTDRQAAEKSFELATKYCSIYQTLLKVAKLEWRVSFE